MDDLLNFFPDQELDRKKKRHNELCIMMNRNIRDNVRIDLDMFEEYISIQRYFFNTHNQKLK